jgi:hypothetical protein
MPINQHAADEFIAGIAKATAEFERKTQTLVEAARRTLVVPFCDQYGLEFNKNGIHWCFCTDDYPYGLDAEKLLTFEDARPLATALIARVPGKEGCEWEAASLMSGYTPPNLGRVGLPDRMRRYLEWGFAPANA